MDGGFPGSGGAWSRLCRRAEELLNTPSWPQGWADSPAGPTRVVQHTTMWGCVAARFVGDTLVGLEWHDSPGETPAGKWPAVWHVGWVDGTPFQREVWAACLDADAVTTYADLAASAGRPGAARAVGSALAANPLAPLVPCHWPGPMSGALGGFRWGPSRKEAWRVWEQGVRAGGQFAAAG